MGTKRSREDIEAAMADLQRELEAAADDDDAEIWVRRGNTDVKLTGRDKQGFMSKFFGDLFGDDDGAGEDGAGEDGAGEDGAGDDGAGDDGGRAPAPRRSYWGSGKR